MTNPLKSYGRPCLDDEDRQAVMDVLEGDFLTGGTAIETFEQDICDVTKAQHALCCANGTAALHMACHALGIGPGTSVIVPSVTFLATANVAVMLGADVVFADVNPDSGLMELAHFEEALSRCKSKPAAVLPVHLAGQVVDLPAIRDIAKAKNMYLIEDACHAFGTTYTNNAQTHYVGDCQFSDVTMFSFHAVKNITTGEGGALTTNDPNLYQALCDVRSHGMVRDPVRFENRALGFEGDQVNPWYYEMPDYGYNYRLTDIQAALGSTQIKKLPEFAQKRAELVAAYNKEISSYAPNVLPLKNINHCEPVWHIYPLLIDFEGLGKTRAHVMNALSEAGIGSQVHYIPVHLQPFYRAQYPDLDLPGALKYYSRTLTLPLHPQMETSHVEHAVQTLAEILEI